MTPRILITDAISEDGIAFLRAGGGLEVVHKTELPTDDLLREIESADALIVRSKTKVTREVIEAGKSLKVIGRAGAGVDNIDLPAATRRGIVVMNTPGGNSAAVAEHTFALLLALARKLPSADASLKRGEWNKSVLMGQELGGKTLGVVGLGKIGSRVAKLGRGFGMRVVAFDPFVNRRYADELGVELLDLGDLLKNSECVTLHLPVTEQTRGLIRKDSLAVMKPGALLVNAARGGLVDEPDLLEALDSGPLAGAALDVFADEPRPNPLLVGHDAIVATPHIAGSTREAQSKVGLEIAKQVADYLRDGLIANAVNFPSVSDEERTRLLPYLRLSERLGRLIGGLSRLRYDQIGLRYYGDLTELNCKAITNHALKEILQPAFSEPINAVNARALAQEREIEVVETTSTRKRSYPAVISLQLRSREHSEWVEGALLHQGGLHLVSVDGIPIEAPLGDSILFIRNEDTPGVIGKVGTLLGQGDVNIASFVLGRGGERAHAVGVVNTDSPVPNRVLSEIRKVDSVLFAEQIDLGNRV